MDKLISWFEIPALDLKKASAFYEQMLGVTLHEEKFGPTWLAVFPYNRELATGGCVIKGDGYKPSRDGAVIYLNAGDSLDSVLDRVVPAGGRIVVPKTNLPPGVGAFAHILDTEGNWIGIHGAS